MEDPRACLPIAPFEERAPWFGPDLQTIRNILAPAPPDLPGGERLLLPVSGGDRLVARIDGRAAAGARPLIVLVHGLTGSEESRNVSATARRLVSEGWPVMRLNLRGAGPSRATSSGRYHAGRTEDLAAALRALPPELVRHGIVLVGHSLGGNLVLKFMGEPWPDTPVLGAVAVSAPLDLAATSAHMMRPRNVIYHRYLLQALKHEALAPGAGMTAAERSTVREARSIFEFDDRFVAPLFGYRDATAYYEANSCGRFLNAIDRPTLLIHALDDPWIPPSAHAALDWSRPAMIETAFSRKGGHLGFHGRGSPIPWHDRVMTSWLARRPWSPRAPLP
ncbi:MAG: YheT family hydrolase [Methylocystis sp.]|uniref:YheT family hydrolase n=1 Tax=Methylocystis sp. TaxID=1911079 RepID=UPI003DA3F8F4